MFSWGKGWFVDLEWEIGRGVSVCKRVCFLSCYWI